MKGNYKTERKSGRGEEVFDVMRIRHVDSHGQSERGCSSIDDEMAVLRSEAAMKFLGREREVGLADLRI